MNPEQPKKVIQGMSKIYQALKLYPARHPMVTRQVQELQGEMALVFQEKNPLSLGFLDGTLFFEDHLFVDPGPAENEIGRILGTAGLDHLEFHRGLTGEEALKFFQITRSIRLQGEEAWAEELNRQGIENIRPKEARSLDESKSPRQIYNRALKVVDGIFQDVRLGKIPSCGEAMNVVKGMVQLTLSEPHALFALSMLKDYDNYTFTHSVNVAVLSLMVGRSCSLPEEKLRLLGLGGLLHDLGKLKIDRDIITKPGRLTDKEFEQIRQHPVTGAAIVQEMDGSVEDVVDIVLGHHLHFDREGYPSDVRGRKLSPLVDMAAIADTYDAITTLRCYQRPMTPRQAVERMRELSGSILHPDYLERFILALGTYPVGTLVRLDSSEVGLVIWVDTRDTDSVRIKILFDENGTPMENPEVLELGRSEIGRIIAEVDPFLRGIDITDHLDLPAGLPD